MHTASHDMCMNVIIDYHTNFMLSSAHSVNTPTKTRGVGAGKAADLTYWEGAARVIANVSTSSKIIVEKSTVPVKTAEAIEKVGVTWQCLLYIHQHMLHVHIDDNIHMLLHHHHAHRCSPATATATMSSLRFSAIPSFWQRALPWRTLQNLIGYVNGVLSCMGVGTNMLTVSV